MKKMYAYCIAYECPKLNRNKECPLLEIDHLSFHDKIIWIDQLKDDRIEAILNFHQHCSQSWFINIYSKKYITARQNILETEIT